MSYRNIEQQEWSTPAKAGVRPRRVCGAHESYDALTRFQTPAFAGVALNGEGRS